MEARSMKKTTLCVIIMAVLGTCAVTNAMATPAITGVRGGYGVIATVSDADGFDWKIEIAGAHIFQGGLTEGAISGSNTTTIRTPILPPTLGIGKINITVSLVFIIPLVVEDRSAFMLGPFVLFMQ
jgi:hypothetical protein